MQAVSNVPFTIFRTLMTRRTGGYEQFLTMLHQGEALTYEEFAQRLGCSARTIQRLIEHARNEGTPLAFDKDGRKNIVFIPEDRRETGMKVNLSDQEILALAIAAQAAQSSLGPTPLGSPLHSGIAKLLEALPGEFHLYDFEEMHEQWHFSNTPSALLDPEVFRQLMHAVEQCETLQITYFTAKRNEETERRIDPYGFAAPKGSWMVVAWCHKKRKFLNFSIADIREIVPTGTNFIREDFDLDTHFAGQFGGVGGEKMYDVTFLIEPDRVAAFRRKQYHASQNLEALPDGRARVRFHVAGLEDIRSFAQSWGTGITVEEPEELVEIMREEGVELVGRYGNDSHTTDSTRDNIRDNPS